MSGSGGSSAHIARAVDQLLAARKTLSGIAEWKRGNPDHEFRAVYPVLAEGESLEASLNMTAYPGQPVEGSPDCRFMIGLFLPKCVWRIDFEPHTEAHPIPPDRVHLLDGVYMVRGPHYHAWADNRYLVKRASLPSELKAARALPPQIRRFEQAFRWFCDQTRIIVGPGQVLDLPAKSTLV